MFINFIRPMDSLLKEETGRIKYLDRSQNCYGK